MTITKDANLLLQAMKEHEEVIARLYEIYAEKFPEHRNFWTELSKEEIQHADWIDKLWARIEEGSQDIVVDRFPMVAIEHSIKFVNKQIAKAVDADFELINALSTALDIEKALIDSKYFEVFEGDSKETVRTLASLASGTEKHFQRIQEMLLKLCK